MIAQADVIVDIGRYRGRETRPKESAGQIDPVFGMGTMSDQPYSIETCVGDEPNRHVEAVQPPAKRHQRLSTCVILPSSASRSLSLASMTCGLGKAPSRFESIHGKMRAIPSHMFGGYQGLTLDRFWPSKRA